ncbi:hypothetical protein INT45_013273 [Circinella minor]|uniref:Uncharacterized protein n=1 Tax=Circinella minor TaxID=1195481 RepID=A0A8H7S559_9FUNG|nr:hypothetical protein INT45_013273 [Circinella minor]
MNPEQMEHTIRRLDDLQHQKIKLVDKYEQDIKSAPLVINEEGEPQTTIHTAIIALSTDPMRLDNTQPGGYSIIPFNKTSPLLFGYHDGKSTGTIIFSLKAVRKVMKTIPNNESLTIITRNKVVAESGCIEDIEKMFAERTAPVYGYFMNPEQNVDWMKDFGELARKVASEARKLALVTDDDRQWDEAHKMSVSLPHSSVQQVTQQGLQQDPRHSMQHDPRQSMQQIPPQAIQQGPPQSLSQAMQQDPRQGILQIPPQAVQQIPVQAMQQNLPQVMQQDLPQPMQQNHPQDLQNFQGVQSSPAPVSDRPLGPLGQKAWSALDKWNRTHGERIQSLKMRGGNLGIICNKHIRLHRQQYAPDRVHIAFLAISTDSRRPDGYQFGGYSVVWVDSDCTSNQYNYYDNPDSRTPSFLLLALRDALRKCPKHEPLLIATTGHDIVNSEINYIIESRKAPTVAFLIAQYPQYSWVKQFYEMGRNVASESRKLGNERNFEPLPDQVFEPVPVVSSSDQLSVQKPESKRPKKQANFDTNSIVRRLREIEKRHKELLEFPNKTIKIGDQSIDLKKQPYIRVAIIAMSIDVPHGENRGQVGGFGVVWLNKDIGNQFGNYNSFEGGAVIFLLKAIKELLAECPSEDHLIIGSTNEAIHNFINNIQVTPSEVLHDAGTCVVDPDIENQIRKRKASTTSILLDKSYFKNPWIKCAYDMSRNVASESRKLWYACSEEETYSFTPSRIEKDEEDSSSLSIIPPTKQVRKDPVQMVSPRLASSSITYPDEIDWSLVNQFNQHSLEGIHSSRAAAIGLINEPPFSTSVVESSDSNGVQMNRNQASIPLTPGPTPYYYQENKYNNKRSITEDEEEEENESNKRQRIDDSEDEGGDGVINRLGKWMNRMFRR